MSGLLASKCVSALGRLAATRPLTLAQVRPCSSSSSGYREEAITITEDGCVVTQRANIFQLLFKYFSQDRDCMLASSA